MSSKRKPLGAVMKAARDNKPIEASAPVKEAPRPVKNIAKAPEVEESVAPDYGI